jgi:hypothetical protein
MGLKWAPEWAQIGLKLGPRWATRTQFKYFGQRETVSKPPRGQLRCVRIELAGGAGISRCSDRKPGWDLRRSDAVIPSVYVSQILDNAEFGHQNNAM